MAASIPSTRAHQAATSSRDFCLEAPHGKQQSVQGCPRATPSIAGSINSGRVGPVASAGTGTTRQGDASTKGGCKSGLQPSMFSSRETRTFWGQKATCLPGWLVPRPDVLPNRRYPGHEILELLVPRSVVSGRRASVCSPDPDCSRSAKGAAARLAGVEVPKHDDTEKTFADLKARLAKTAAFVQSFKPNDAVAEPCLSGRRQPRRRHSQNYGASAG